MATAEDAPVGDATTPSRDDPAPPPSAAAPMGMATETVSTEVVVWDGRRRSPGDVGLFAVQDGSSINEQRVEDADPSFRLAAESALQRAR
jgi:hypothetical protein